MYVKSEIRILGFDDGPFDRNKDKKVLVFGVVFRGGAVLDGALKTEVKVDGLDSTVKITKLINSSRHKQQLKIIMFDGITFGGFNIIDINKVHEDTRIPVVVINRKMPDFKKVKSALKNFDDFEKRWELIEMAGTPKECKLNNGKKLFYQAVGIGDEAEDVICMSSTRGDIPEPLRVAHLLATAFVKGESHGRA